MPVIDEIIGLPPIHDANIGGGFNVKDHVKDSMPIMDIWPCMPTASMSLQGFRLTSSWKDYEKDLSYLGGYSYRGERGKIRVAFLSDNPPSETFTNMFGDHLFATGVNEVMGEVGRQISFMTGGMGPAEVWNRMQEALSKSENMAFRSAGGMMSSTANMGSDLARTIGRAMNATDEQVNRFGRFLNEVAKGARIDFPQIWKSSDFSPSYSINVRLFNPWPGNLKAHENRIIGPLACLLLFVVPISQDGVSYKWPYMCKFKIPGLVQIFAGYVRNISVVKGGDENVITYIQRPTVVDVKIDFGILYATILNTQNNVLSSPDIPTLSDYLKELRGGKSIKPSSYTAMPHKYASNETEGIPDIASYSNPTTSLQDINRNLPYSRISDDNVDYRALLENNFNLQAERGYTYANETSSIIKNNVLQEINNAQQFISFPSKFDMYADNALTTLQSQPKQSVLKIKNFASNIASAPVIPVEKRNLAQEAATSATNAENYINQASNSIDLAKKTNVSSEKYQYIENAKNLLAQADIEAIISANKFAEIMA